MNSPGPIEVQRIGRRYIIASILFGCTVASSRWWLAATYATNIPYLDQWGAEGLDLYLKIQNGSLRLADLFAPHNEHRIFFTHLQNLALFQLSGAWLPKLEIAVNALWYGAIGGIVHHTFAPYSSGKYRYAALLLLLVVFCAPFGWQNALWGFQSQHYFGLLLAAVASICLFRKIWRQPSWWIGFAAALALPLATSFGAIATVALLSAFVLVSRGRKIFLREHIHSLAALGLSLAVALLLMRNVPQHAYLKAQSPSMFLGSFLRCLAWPSIDFPAATVIAWAPCIVFFVTKVKDAIPERATWSIAFFAALAVLDSASVAYARAGGLPDLAPISRYQEVLAWGALANGAALIALLQAQFQPRVCRYLTVVWIAVFMIGLLQLTALNFRLHLPFKQMSDARQQTLIAEYLSTRNTTVLEGKAYWEIGHPSAQVVKQVLDEPRLASKLSPEVNPGSVVASSTATAIDTVLSTGMFLTLLCGSTLLLFYRSRPGPKCRPEASADAG
jgi:hypothetical protein